ncbi:MAG: lysophospholipid acyltransferase family protein [Planctomycetaceae bacterium]
MRQSKFRHRCEYFLFRCAVCLLQLLSVRQTIQLGRFVSWLMTDLLPRRVTRYNVAADNIRQAFPEMSDENVTDTIRKMWAHLARVVAEMVQLPRKLTLENCRECVTFRNRQPVVEALTQGRPVLILGGHFGNWEVSIASFGLFGFPMGVIAREMDNPYLHRWFARERERAGHRLYLKQGSYDGITELMQAGGNMALLGDQDAGKRGVFVDFFGKPASTFKSIALMAMEYDALLVMGYGIRLPDDLNEGRWARFEIGCEAVIDPQSLTSDDPIKEITEQYTQALERAIRRAPEQYFWVHRRWKTAPRIREQSKPARRAA